jgi:hypothetical protein
MACANAVGLLPAFVERVSSSLLNNGGGGGGGTIARSALTHLAGTGRVYLVNDSTCLHRLVRVVRLSNHPGDWINNNCNGSKLEQSGGVPRCAAGVLATEMACGVDPGTSVLEVSTSWQSGQWALAAR